MSPFRHGMARPQSTDGGDVLQTWKVAVNISNNQSRTAEGGGSPAWGLGEGLSAPHCRKNQHITKSNKDTLIFIRTRFPRKTCK